MGVPGWSGRRAAGGSSSGQAGGRPQALRRTPPWHQAAPHATKVSPLPAMAGLLLGRMLGEIAIPREEDQ
eukprot:12932618-Prorocentrum_lima.AAC.1